MQTLHATKVSKQESLVLIKNMIRISISSICYFRDLFPHSCYKKKQYGAMEIHQLQGAVKNSSDDISIINQDAFLVTQWLERGVFAALENEYVSTMTFAIFTRDANLQKDVLLETYQFSISYPSEGKPGRVNNVDLNSKEAVKSQAGKLIRSLTEFTATLDDLPNERWITIEIQYRDNAPAEYQPEFFQSSLTGILAGKTLPLVVNIGQLQTSGIDMKVKFAGFESLLVEDIAKEMPLPTETSSVLDAFVHKTDANVLVRPSEKKFGVHNEPAVVSNELEKMDLSEKVKVASVDRIEKNKISDASQEQVIEKYIKDVGHATAKQAARALHAAESLVERVFERMKSEGILFPKGKTFYLTSSDPQQNSVRHRENTESLPNPQLQSNSIPAENTATPMQIEPTETVEPPLVNFSQSSEKSMKARKFSVIKDPIQIFQDHKRSRT